MAKRSSTDEETRPHKKRSTDHQGKPSAPSSLISLQTFLSNFFFGIFVQDQEDIFELTFNRGYTRDLVEDGNGTKFTFSPFKTFLKQQRQIFSDRQLVSQSFVVESGDAAGETGTVGHIITVSAIQQGKQVVLNIVAVVNIVFDEKLGERKIKTESFVLSTN